MDSSHLFSFHIYPRLVSSHFDDAQFACRLNICVCFALIKIWFCDKKFQFPSLSLTTAETILFTISIFKYKRFANTYTFCKQSQFNTCEYELEHFMRGFVLFNRECVAHFEIVNSLNKKQTAKFKNSHPSSLDGATPPPPHLVVFQSYPCPYHPPPTAPPARQRRILFQHQIDNSNVSDKMYIIH